MPPILFDDRTLHNVRERFAALVSERMQAIRWILNSGSAQGGQSGMFFDVMRLRQRKDPDSGTMLCVSSATGKVQVTQVRIARFAARAAGASAAGERVVSAA